MRLPLPIDDALPGLLAALRTHPNAVVVAPPGSGKTTRVPPALLDAGLAGARKVLVLQPRRVAARMAARRIAEERGGLVGGEIGYSTRFDRRVGPHTRLEVLTEGLLLRRLQADPFLEEAGVVVLDELHERSLDLDLVLALLREVQNEARPDLRIVAMSATLDPGPIVDFLGGPSACVRVQASGRVFPVELRWDPRPSERPLPDRCASAVRQALQEQREGHVLVFLPSVRTIDETGRLLTQDRERPLPDGVEVVALHGSLPPEAQDRALAPSSGRKVVLATNVAETSVTFPGVRVVIDGGEAVVATFDPSTGSTRLERQRISRSSADQRAGRAGRTGPGLCWRLWTEVEDRQLLPADAPEVRRSDLAPVLLQLRAWGVDPRAFAWFEAPPTSGLDRGEALLERLGAVDAGGITPLGRRLAALPVHPRLARVVLAGRELGVLPAAATAAALADGRDVLARGAGAEAIGEDDLSLRLRLVALAERGSRDRALHRGGLDELQQVRNQLIDLASTDRGPPLGAPSPLAPPLMRALLAGFPDRVAQRRGDAGDRYLLASGSGARLGQDSAARGAPLLLALALDGGARGERAEAWIRIAVALEPEWLVTADVEELVFDEAREAVVQRRVQRHGAIVLRERPAVSVADPEAVAALLASAVRSVGRERLLTLDRDAEEALGRVATLRRRMPELDLPDLTSLDALIEPLCVGRRSVAELRKANVAEAVLHLLTWEQRRALDRFAPERLHVPSGSLVRLQYDRRGEAPPVLAARIQQVFGWMQTPRIADGRLAVLMHLLAPNGRPAQVTQDLASFWASTWVEVRKDLRGRYPRHAWPEDPSEAIPEDRPRRRR